jgi:hypothetical protein
MNLKAHVLSLQPYSTVAAGSSRLRRGESLPSGRQLVSPNGNYVAEIISNFYLTLRRKSSGSSQPETIWSTPFGPPGGGTELVLQWNGDLALINYSNTTVWWTTGTEQAWRDPVLVLRDDGSFLLENSDVPWKAEKTIVSPHGTSG